MSLARLSDGDEYGCKVCGINIDEVITFFQQLCPVMREGMFR